MSTEGTGADGPDNVFYVKIGKATWASDKPLTATGLSEGTVGVLATDNYDPNLAGLGSLSGTQLRNGSVWEFKAPVIIKTWDNRYTVHLSYYIAQPTVTINSSWQGGGIGRANKSIKVTLKCGDITDDRIIDCTTLWTTAWSYGEEDGYDRAGNAVSLSEVNDTITVPTSYNSSGGGYIDTSARWGTTNYKLTAFGYNGGVRALLSGSKGTITADCGLVLSIPSTPTNGAVTIEVKDGANTVVKSGDAILVYKNGYLDGWNAAANVSGKGYINNNGAWCRIPNAATSYGGTGGSTRYDIYATSTATASVTQGSHTFGFNYGGSVSVKKDWYLCNSSGGKEVTWANEYTYYRDISDNCSRTDATATASVTQSVGTWSVNYG